MRPPTERDRAVVDAWFDRYNARDVDGLCDLAHPSIEIVSDDVLVSNMLGTNFRGHAGVRSLMTWVFTTFPEMDATVLRVESVRGRVLVDARYSLRAEAGVAPVEGAALWRIQQGSVLHVQAFKTADDARDFAMSRGSLSPREREVFQLLAEGLNAQEVATRLFLSVTTVRTHVQNGMERLAAQTRVQAIALAVEMREIEPVGVAQAARPG